MLFFYLVIEYSIPEVYTDADEPDLSSKTIITRLVQHNDISDVYILSNTNKEQRIFQKQ